MNNPTPHGTFTDSFKNQQRRGEALSRWRQIYFGIKENGETYSLDAIEVAVSEAMEENPDQFKLLLSQAAEVLPGRTK